MAAVAREQVLDGQEPKTPVAEAEAPLLAILRRRLAPEDQRRLSSLRTRKEEGALTPEEHAELLAYVDRVEQQDAERAQALLDLARLRKMPLAALMTDLGLISDA